MRKHNNAVKVITGIRRCGKSYLLNEIFYNDLIKNGVDPSHIIRFAFDSANDLNLIGEDVESLSKNDQKLSPRKFMEFLEAKLIDGDRYYLLLDEIQNLGAFEYVLNGYLRRRNLDIYVTGSNSKFLSKDIITEFAGRGDEIHVLPLSFSEFYPYCDKNADPLDLYMTFGGLPDIVKMQSEEQKMAYLQAQMKNVYLKDIVKRNNLSSNKNIKELLNVIASGISALTNPKKLSNTFRSVKGSKISDLTIDKYIGYMEDSFLLSKAKRYDVKGKRYINTPYKIYFEDVGLRNGQLSFRQIEKTHIMENIIYNELRYRGYNVDVGVVPIRENINGSVVRKQLEIDFIANLASKRYYIQSVYEIPSEEKMRQETRSFDKTGDSFKKIIIVENNILVKRNEKGYMMIGIRDFLLNPNSLEL